jgi:hypothetical protein
MLSDELRPRLEALSQAEILARVSDPTAFDTLGRPLSLLRRLFLGGVQLAPTGNATTVTGATHAITVLTNRWGGENDPAVDTLPTKADVECWESAFLSTWPDSFERSAVLASRAEQDGIVKTSTGNFDFVAASMILMVAFIIAALSQGLPFGRSRIALALLGVSIVSFSVMVAYGITVAIGFSLTPATQLSFFILLSIGADIVFALTAEYDRRKVAFIAAHSTPGSLPPLVTGMSRNSGGAAAVAPAAASAAAANMPAALYCSAALLEQQIPHLISEAVRAIGASLLYTGLTSFLAFISTSSTAFPILRNFSISTGIAVLINTMLMFTVFVGGLTLDERRKLRGRRDCLCCTSAGPAVAVAMDPASRVNGFAGSAANNNVRAFEDDGGASVVNDTTELSPIAITEQNAAHSLQSAPRLERMFGKYGVMFTSKAVCAVIVVVYLIALGFAAWGASMTDASFSAADFLPNGSESKRFIDERTVGFGDEVGVSVVYDVDTDDFSSLGAQATLENMFQQIVASEWFRADQTFSVFHTTLMAARAAGAAPSDGYIPSPLFDTFLNATLNAPGLGPVFAADVVRANGDSCVFFFFFFFVVVGFCGGFFFS